MRFPSVIRFYKGFNVQKGLNRGFGRLQAAWGVEFRNFKG